MLEKMKKRRKKIDGIQTNERKKERMGAVQKERKNE